MRQVGLDWIFEQCQPVPYSGCWLWTKALKPHGYGEVSRQSYGTGYAHILAYVAKHGEVPAGTELDHLCRVRCCCNPDHLEAVTHRENNRRGLQNGTLALRKWHSEARSRTHCERGHEFTPENTYYRQDRPGTRQCRACCRLSDAKRRPRQT